MQKKLPEKVFTIIWTSFLIVIALFFYFLTTVTGGFGQFDQLDHNRMLDFNDRFALSLYVICAVLYVGHSIIPKLARGPNAEFVGFVMKLAVLESIALFGFVLGQIKQDAQAGLVFFVLSLMGIVRVSPLLKKEKAERPSTPMT